MTQATIEIIKLTASEGKTLTNGKMYGKEVYLGCNDSADNWHEIDDGDVPQESEAGERCLA